MMNDVVVTCLIPSFNKLAYLKDAIKSVEMQTYKNIELIVADDASDDFDEPSLNIDYERFLRVVVIHNKQNLGTVRNLNNALKQATGEIIMPLSCDDCFYDDNVVEKVVTRMQAMEAKVLSCSRLAVDEISGQCLGILPCRSFRKRIERGIDPYKSYVDYAVGRFNQMASGSAFYYTAEFIRNRGYYDEDYYIWEDGPLFIQTLKEGMPLASAYDIISIKYRTGGVSEQKSDGVVTHAMLNDLSRIYEKEYLPYMSQFSFIKRISIRLAYDLAKRQTGLRIRDLIKSPIAGTYLAFIRLQNRILQKI